jgi:hypothetical protein
MITKDMANYLEEVKVREIFLSEQRNLRGSEVKMGKKLGFQAKKGKRMNINKKSVSFTVISL